MINVKELRIGSVIRSSLTKQPHTVTGVLPLNGKYVIYTSLQTSYSDPADWEPVELNPDILRRANFRNSQSKYFVIDLTDSSAQGQIEYYKGNCFVVGWDEERVGEPIESLHQLQNVYLSLSGKELIINL